jgi:hypothetical protein
LAVIRRAWMAPLLLSLGAVLCLPMSLSAQIGLASGVARITLVARAAPGGRISDLNRIRETRRSRGIREGSALLRFSTNSAYRLIVRRLAGDESRVWVRSGMGEYQEVRADAPITVLVQKIPAVDKEWELQFRQEAAERSEESAAPPLRYDLVIAPSL